MFRLVINFVYKQQRSRMRPSIKSKPIPFASVQAQCTQLLKQKQTQPHKAKVKLDEDEYMIPDEYSTMRAEAVTPKSHTFLQNSSKSKCNQQANAFNLTYSSMNNSNSANVIGSISQRLTHGLSSYKDIKSSFNAHNTSGSKDKERHSMSRSGSQSKRPLKLLDQHLNRGDAESIQCTFTPKTNTNASQSYRSFKDFVNFQESFLSRREEKVKKMKKQLEDKEVAEMTSIPVIDKKSKKMSECTTQYHMDSRGSLKKSQRKVCTYERLYKIPRKKDRIYEQQSSFTPKILHKSKSLVRNDKVENLLYEDAQRRIGQQKLIESEVYKKEPLLPRCPGSSQKKTKVQNQLICKKIRGEFLQLLQTSWPEDPEEQEAAIISPILAVTILSQLFNVELNPNKNEELCWLIVSYLVDGNNQADDMESDPEKSAVNGNVETKRLWEFIKAIVVGTAAYQKDVSSFTEQQFQKINSQLGYFYALRLSKWPNRMEQVQDEPEHKIETSKTTNKLAEVYRQKKLQQISEFISQTKIGQPVSSMIASKNGNINEEAELIQERLIRLQDLFILDSIRKKAQLEQQRLRNQQSELKNCTFRPSLNEKTIQKAMQRKVRSRSKQNLRAVTECQVQQTKELELRQVKQKNKKIIIKTKNTDNRSSLAEERMSAFKQNNMGQTCRNIKDVDKTLLRLNIARKMKDVEQTQKQRGYNFKTSNNWLKCAQEQKKQILGEVSNFLGYKDNSVEKDRNMNENYQSCQLK